jgi:hypothetical protein
MKALSLFTQGIKGGQTKEAKQGYFSVFLGNTKLLFVDNYRGYGENYIQREEPVIGICGNDGECIFEGTHDQLIQKLKSKVV